MDTKTILIVVLVLAVAIFAYDKYRKKPATNPAQPNSVDAQVAEILKQEEM